MGTHCERNRVPHERYILPSQPTAPFRDVAFHIAAVSPLVPIADRYRLTYALARARVRTRFFDGSRSSSFCWRKLFFSFLAEVRWRNEFHAEIEAWCFFGDGFRQDRVGTGNARVCVRNLVFCCLLCCEWKVRNSAWWVYLEFASADLSLVFLCEG